MTRKLVVLALCLLTLPALAQKPEVKITPLKDSLYLLQGRGGNVVASLGDDGVLMIDNDFANYRPAYQAALDSLGDAEARFVINTHWHGDHTGGNAGWGESGSVILAHDNVRQRLSTTQVNKFFDRTTEASPAAAWPLVTYADSLALHVNGDTVEVQHYPAGHTDGDSVIFFVNANVVHMGDHYFKDRFPFVDLASGGSVDGFVDNIAGLLERVDGNTIIVPGHGDLANRADLKRYHQMLLETRKTVRDMLARGMDLEAIQARGLGKKWEAWGEFFINEDAWISFIVASS